MQQIPVIAAAGLVAAAFSADRRPPTADQDDGEVWDAIVSGRDVLLGASFDEAVREHPLRVESLVTQRVFRPFLLLCSRLVRPWATVASIDEQLRSAWLGRNRSLRSSWSGLSVRALADADASSWRSNSRLLVDTMSVPTEEVGRVKAVMASRRPDIHRAFEECRELIRRASCVAGTDSFGWLVLLSVVDDMEAVVLHIVDAQILEGSADIVPDLGFEDSDRPDAADRFGAVSLSDDRRLPTADQKFGYHGAHEEFILSGHRAPSVGLPQYRRMGGRVFG